MIRTFTAVVLALFAVTASAQPGGEADARRHVQALAGRGDAQTTAAIEIAKLRDPDADMAIQALL
ncbi:MAG: hypothetical protein ABGY41_10870, partial [Candidatus Poribacteria bacterium]